MFKKLTLLAVGLLLLVSPLVSSAQTTSAVQAQIDAFLKQITQLQAQIATLRGQSSPSSIPTTNATCASFTRDFSSGATDGTTNGEVSKLQQFLINAGVYPEALVTGYFGPATSRALQRWQTANGISISTAGIGSFGPKTRAAIQSKCGGTTTAVSQSGTFSDFGMSFTYPTTLEKYNIGQKYFTYNGEVSLFGGKGTIVPDAGTFGKQAFMFCYPKAECVTDNSSTGSAADVTINGYQFKRTVTQPAGNNLGRISYQYTDSVKNIVLYEFEFFFGAQGFYTTYDAAKSASDSIMASVKITPYNHANAYQVALNQPPVISSFTGPTTLAVNQTGTWTVQVSDPENSTMEYYVSWDETQIYDNSQTGTLKTVPRSQTGLPTVPCCTSTDERVQSTTLSHAFKTAGTYNVRFSARERDTYRGTTEKTLVVIVGN